MITRDRPGEGFFVFFPLLRTPGRSLLFHPWKDWWLKEEPFQSECKNMAVRRGKSQNTRLQGARDTRGCPKARIAGVATGHGHSNSNYFSRSGCLPPSPQGTLAGTHLKFKGFIMEMTITEALEDVRLTEKKILKSIEILCSNVVRYNHVDDPFEKYGGSMEIQKRELQSMHDLGERRVGIREAIAKANLETMLKIGDHYRSITGWLTWRREVAEVEQETMVRLVKIAEKEIKQAQDNPRLFKEKDDEEAKLAKLVLNVDIHNLNTKAMEIEDVLGVLDGKLSLLNATTVIEIPD